MFPPQPTKDPHALLGNLWQSLRRAADGHWGDEATLEPADDGYKATLRFSGPMTDRSWELASKYMRSYARASHWTVHKLSRRKTHAEMLIGYSPPKPKKKRHREQHPEPPKTS